MNAARVESSRASAADSLQKSVTQNQKKTWRKSRFSWHLLKSFEKAWGSHKTQSRSLFFGFTLECHIDPVKATGGPSDKMNIYTKLKFQTISIAILTRFYIYKPPPEIHPKSTKIPGTAILHKAHVALSNHSKPRQVTQNLQKMIIIINFQDLLRQNCGKKSETFPELRYSPLLWQGSPNLWKKVIKPFLVYQSCNEKTAWKFRLFRMIFRWNTAGRKRRRISWRTIKFAWPLTVNHRVIQTNQGTCTPCRWWHFRKKWIFRLFFFTNFPLKLLQKRSKKI